jgi:hypothetical protein
MPFILLMGMVLVSMRPDLRVPETVRNLMLILALAINFATVWWFSEILRGLWAS